MTPEISKEAILDSEHWKFVEEVGLTSIHTKTFPEAYREQALRAMESYSSSLLKENEELKDGLNKAVEVIKQWHNRDEVWDIYFNNAPEMNPVKQLINKNHVSK